MIDFQSACVKELEARFGASVWYQVVDGGVLNIGYGDLVYYKIKDGEVIFKALY